MHVLICASLLHVFCMSDVTRAVFKYKLYMYNVAHASQLGSCNIYIYIYIYIYIIYTVHVQPRLLAGYDLGCCLLDTSPHRYNVQYMCEVAYQSVRMFSK